MVRILERMCSWQHCAWRRPFIPATQALQSQAPPNLTPAPHEPFTHFALKVVQAEEATVLSPELAPTGGST